MGGSRPDQFMWRKGRLLKIGSIKISCILDIESKYIKQRISIRLKMSGNLMLPVKPPVS